MKEAFKKIIEKIKGMAPNKTNGKTSTKGKTKGSTKKSVKASDSDKLPPYEELANIILVMAKHLNYDFCTFEGETVYIYIKTHWQRISSYELKIFLKECLCSLLDNDVRGSNRKSIEDLVKQFPFSIMSLNVKPAKNKINFLNGTLDLVTGNFEQHNPKDYLRYVLPYNYGPNATCPKFGEYIKRVVPDRDVQNVLAEYIAWLFTDIKLEKVLFLYGSGCNGKSVFIDIIEALVGKDNVCHESITDMCGENGSNHRSNIVGKLLNTCSDVAPNSFHGDLFKRLASGEPISTKVLYQDVNSTTDYAKMLFSLNELPKTKDLTDGYFRRLLIVPFKVQIPKNEINPNLAKEIIANELPGVMRWVLIGYSRLLQNQRFSHSKVIDSALEEYRNKYNTKKKKSLIILPPY